MTKFEIKTTDKELVYALWDLQGNGITIEEELNKAEGATHIAVWISAGSAFVSAVATVVNVTLTHRKKHPDKTKATAYISQDSEALRVILDATGGEIEIAHRKQGTE